MLNLVDKENYEDGQVIFEEGTSEDRIYVILSGSVEISKKANNRKHIMEVIEKGDVFGGARFLGGRHCKTSIFGERIQPTHSTIAYHSAREIQVL
jgi:CRP-like cAMP-binding protein